MSLDWERLKRIDESRATIKDYIHKQRISRRAAKRMSSAFDNEIKSQRMSLGLNIGCSIRRSNEFFMISGRFVDKQEFDSVN